MKLIKKIFIVLIFVILIVGISFIHSGYNMYKEAINQCSLEEKINKIKEKKSYTEINEIPTMYKNAVISVEDRRFYKHKGIDILAITRAIINDIKAMDFVEGGSTITQQLAKNMYFTQEKKIERKIAEVFMAKDIEKKYKKDEILELYLNSIYFGSGYYTVKDACRGYFNKDLKEMTDYECILLAGIPNAPSVYSPNVNLELTKKRQKQVIDKMVKYKCLTQEEANRILETKKNK